MKGERFYPRGQLPADDEGQIQIRIGIKDGQTLIIDFGKPVAWIGLGLADVEGLIAMLRTRADEMRRAQT